MRVAAVDQFPTGCGDKRLCALKLAEFPGKTLTSRFIVSHSNAEFLVHDQFTPARVNWALPLFLSLQMAICRATRLFDTSIIILANFLLLEIVNRILKRSLLKMANSSFSYQPPAWAFRFLPDPSWSENPVFLIFGRGNFHGVWVCSHQLIVASNNFPSWHLLAIRVRSLSARRFFI